MIEHWVHLRCAGICLAQYTNTWTCHQHKESSLTTHTDITPPSQTLAQTAYIPQPKHRHISHFPHVPPGLVKSKPNSLTPSRAKQTQGAQTAYSRHTYRYHHNSGNQAHPERLNTQSI